MKIIVIDPGCSGPQGHNGAMFEEFASALPELGFALSYCVSRNAAAGALAAPGVVVQRLFTLDGYASLSPVLASDDAFADAIAVIEQELRTVEWSGVEAVLMPTVYPLHLIGLARVLADVVPAGRVHVSAGLLMPVSFWIPQAPLAEAIGALMLGAIEALQHHCHVLAYSETGEYDFGGTRLELPRLLPPVSAATARRMQMLLDDAPRADPGRPVRFGFFGSPFSSKGIDTLRLATARVIEGGNWRNELHLLLPQGHDRLVRAFAGLGPQVHASSQVRSNADFLAAMALVDVVLLPYDPSHYASKLSGVLIEALALGKPVVITDGCLPMARWLEQTVPGSYVSCAHDPQALADVLGLPGEALLPLQLAARESAALVAGLKSMRRYLVSAGVQMPLTRKVPLHLVESQTMVAPAADRSSFPLVSIVIPAWNRETMIEAAIESALAQSVPQIEVIVVDNASTDATAAVAERVALRDPRVRVYRNADNVGPVRNWIEGLRRARAPFVKLLFSDDLMDPRFIERMLPPLLDPEIAFSVCQAIIGEAPWKGRLFYAAFNDNVTLSREAFEVLSLSAIGRLPLSPGAGLFRHADLMQSLRTHLDGVRDYDFSATGSGVDWLSYLLTAQRYPKVAYVAQPLAFFRSHPGSLTIGDRDGSVWRGYQLAAAWFQQMAAAA